MIDGLQGVRKWMEVNKCPHWIIYIYNTKHRIAESSPLENLTIEQSLKEFTTLLDSLNWNGVYSMTIRPKAKDSNGCFYMDAKFSPSDNPLYTEPAKSVANIGSPSITQDQITYQINQALELQKKDFEIERLKDQMQRDKDDKMHPVLGRLLDMAEPYIGKFFDDTSLDVQPKIAGSSCAIAQQSSVNQSVILKPNFSKPPEKETNQKNYNKMNEIGAKMNQLNQLCVNSKVDTGNIIDSMIQIIKVCQENGKDAEKVLSKLAYKVTKKPSLLGMINML